MSFAERVLALTLLSVLLCCRLGNCTEEPDTPLVRNNNAQWRADSSTIVFQSDAGSGNCDIWSIGADGTGLQRHTTSQSEDFSPCWTADTAGILFLTCRNGSRELWRRDLATGSEEVVLARRLSDYAISHDSELLATAVMREDTRGIVIVSLLSGAEQLWLCTGSGTPCFPAWSPDDAKVAFAKDGDIWISELANRSALHKVTSLSENAHPKDLSWGSSGSLAFVSDDKLYCVGADGNDLRCVYYSPGCLPMRPSWSPDGSRIAFTRLGDYAEDIWTVASDGTSPVQVTHTTSTPAFTPVPGTYSGTQYVTLESSTGATIRYTIDGADPNESSPIYDGTPIEVAQSTTLKAKAWKTDWFPSFIGVAEYLVQ